MHKYEEPSIISRLIWLRFRIYKMEDNKPENAWEHLIQDSHTEISTKLLFFEENV